MEASETPHATNANASFNNIHFMFVYLTSDFVVLRLRYSQFDYVKRVGGWVAWKLENLV